MTAVSAATATTDLYPTRSGETTEVLPRTGPIVFGSPEDGPLEAADLKHFEDTGYLTIDQLITSEELTLFTDELQRLSRDPEVKADERTVVEAESDEVRSIFDIHRTNEIFRKIANDPRLVDRARQILGTDVYIHQSRINYKPGFVGKEFSWHSDFETWHAEDGMPTPRAVSLSLSLTDNYSFNGPLMIMPGSHKRYISCVGGTPEDNYRKSLIMQGAGTPDRQTLSDFADEYGIDVLEGAAGGAIMFDSNCMHASNGNVTPFSRSNIFIVYNSVENTCVEPFAAPKPRPEFVGSTDFTPAGR
ncbi:MAG: ectoine hydroxylase [Brevibacterium sp.]|uniref:Ectoine hydroxylase n=2 Tax=Brevibacterium linens TaxID=1703 RepID=A0A2H1JJG8_BRELN|nr:ectoine hydroxylase [Brevibacterium linens]AZU02236.1 ectoine hydroxylase [Brevibacterium linens]KAB1948692.1 ectoine hydroxylase [Brevibacterium linens ATCC 9172]SMX83346.1 ectoine hydroxylase [Brevibacterium linens ATCC 9172]SMX87607.1 ectoine hydroxylase [Brevibacterium linens]